MYVSVSLPLGGDHSLALFTLCSLSLVFGCLYVLRMLSHFSLRNFCLSCDSLYSHSRNKHETLGKIPHDLSIHLFLLISILWRATSCVCLVSRTLFSCRCMFPLFLKFFFVTRKRTGCRERMYVSRQFVPLFSFSRTRTVSVLKGLLVTLTVKCLTLCLSPEKFVSFSSSVLCPFIEGQIAFPGSSLCHLKFSWHVFEVWIPISSVTRMFLVSRYKNITLFTSFTGINTRDKSSSRQQNYIH